MTDKKHIFISYSTRNKTFVDNFRQDLQDADLSVWIDQEGLTAGTPNWERALRDAIRGAYAFVLIASPEAYESRYVQGEIEVANMYSCPIFPVWAGGDNWGECVPLDMIKMHHADMRDSHYSTGLRQIVEQLQKLNPKIDVEAKPSKTAPVPADFVPRNPYKGLRAFTQKDQNDFFGRDELVNQLIETLNGSNFLAVVGPSGSGKSSVVMAGLFPKLQSGALPNSDQWIYLDSVLPGSNPIEALAIALSDELDSSMSAIIEDLEYGQRGLYLLLRKLSKQKGANSVLFIDQFEELFTQTPNHATRAHFIDLLTHAVLAPDSPCKIIITLRADFYDRPMNYHQFATLMEQYSKSVLPMTVEELRRVIEAPAHYDDVQLTFERELVGDLLYEVRGENSALPLLQFTLDQLFRNRDGLTLTRQAYNAIGGVKGALATHAEYVFTSLPSDKHRTMARSLFLRLIEPGATELDTTRRRARLTELHTSDETQTELMRETADIFVNARLLITDEHTIEVSHEALIREWSRLAEWIHIAHEDIQLQRNISNDATEWLRKGRREDDLYRGKTLEEAEEWMKRVSASLFEVEFITESTIEREQQQQEKQLKEDMVSMLVHDLRSPLGTILTTTVLMQDIYESSYDNLDNDLITMFEIMRNIGERTLNMVDDLYYLRTEAIGFNLEYSLVELNGFLKECLNDFIVEATDKNITLSIIPIENNVEINIDPKWMQRAMSNLLSNGIKYTPELGSVTVTTKPEDNRLLIHVADTGLGIPTEEIEKIFDEFYRVRSPSHMKALGSGLGLSIVRSIVEWHNGRIYVESELGKGSIFTIELPIQS